MDPGKMFLALALLLTTAAHGTSASPGSEWFAIVGRNFTVVNKIPVEGTLAQCPQGNPNYAAFFLSGVVKIRGNFVGADIGVCSTDQSVYGVPETTTISYKTYGDMIIFSVPDRMRSALRLFEQEGKRRIAAVNLSNNFGVSLLTDVGPARESP